MSEHASSNLGGMTTPRLLTLREIAAELDVKEQTVRNYHQMAERRRREGNPKPGDMPPPDGPGPGGRFGRTPVWKLSTIQAWERRRPGRGVGGGRPRKIELEDEGAGGNDSTP